MINSDIKILLKTILKLKWIINNIKSNISVNSSLIQRKCCLLTVEWFILSLNLTEE